mmetsp:Transcript_5104/g.12229  ORF Transcript_5104/g.12229 Transcript_5104/m.12229 type:complete len:203 (+) Transcript_5104:97-705(+)
MCKWPAVCLFMTVTPYLRVVAERPRRSQGGVIETSGQAEADPQLQYPQFSEYVNGVEEINGDFKTQLNESLSTKGEAAVDAAETYATSLDHLGKGLRALRDGVQTFRQAVRNTHDSHAAEINKKLVSAREVASSKLETASGENTNSSMISLSTAESRKRVTQDTVGETRMAPVAQPATGAEARVLSGAFAEAASRTIVDLER